MPALLSGVIFHPHGHKMATSPPGVDSQVPGRKRGECKGINKGPQAKSQLGLTLDQESKVFSRLPLEISMCLSLVQAESQGACRVDIFN